jgi:hypothetical protein
MGLKRQPPAGNTRRVRCTGRNLCGVITNKVGRTVQFESFAERSLLLRLDRRADVVDYLSQPEQMAYTDSSGKRHHYTPDYQVWHCNGRVSLHEVTLEQRLEQPPIQQRHAAATAICTERGWTYHLHTEATLPQGSELANLLALWAYRATRYQEPQVTNALCTRLSDNRQRLYALVMDIQRQSGLSSSRIAGCLYHLLWHDVVQMDWHKLLFQAGVPNPETVLWLKGGES